ncbi:MAG: CDP-alcohol phosphatidyltransferase family protein [Bacteroidales bacterium]|nr:CDP-alcohol phosphatidyltransferase family protein [Bacteroidales bacterium]
MTFKSNLPNLITLLNLICGCIAVILIMNGHFIAAAVMTGAAVLMDFMDGMVARLLHTVSHLGKQLDSLADVVSFGVVPGLLVFMLMSDDPSIPELHAGPIRLVPLAALILTAAAAFRLAVFNLDSRQEKSFRGLPTPANAIFFISLPLLQHSWQLAAAEAPDIFFDAVADYRVLLILVVVFSLLMVSNIFMFSLKFEHYRWQGNRIRWLFLLLSLVLLILWGPAALPVLVILYVVVSLAVAIMGMH